MLNRRTFIKKASLITGHCILLPTTSWALTPTPIALPDIPFELPADWNPIAFNRTRGNAGAIPESYLADINGLDGESQHLGKHLPYQPDIDSSLIPKGFIALMWGDPAKGHARHPNAVRGADNNHEGHWYNWIRIRKAVAESASVTEIESDYSDWPVIGANDKGAYAVYGGGDITADAGKNTIYLAMLPPDVTFGDTIRIWAHCLTHGEYVDFLTL